MYYIKIFLLYSLLGFIMESTLYKVKTINKHSGIFTGPMTAVYGVGIVSIELINKYFFKKIKCHKMAKRCQIVVCDSNFYLTSQEMETIL